MRIKNKEEILCILSSGLFVWKPISHLLLYFALHSTNIYVNIEYGNMGWRMVNIEYIPNQAMPFGFQCCAWVFCFFLQISAILVQKFTVLFRSHSSHSIDRYTFSTSGIVSFCLTFVLSCVSVLVMDKIKWNHTKVMRWNIFVMDAWYELVFLLQTSNHWYVDCNISIRFKYFIFFLHIFCSQFINCLSIIHHTPYLIPYTIHWIHSGVSIVNRLNILFQKWNMNWIWNIIINFHILDEKLRIRKPLIENTMIKYPI